MGDTCVPSLLVIGTAINQLETVTTMKKVVLHCTQIQLITKL